MEYPKINSLYKREGMLDDGTFDKSMKEHLLMLGKHAAEEFGAIKTWRVDEKIDGMNIRIEFMRKDPKNDFDALTLNFGGRTDAALIPANLLNSLRGTFTPEKMSKVFPEANRVMLFGEGYGPKIQACGSKYRTNQNFILFDVVVGGWWLKREDVKAIADQLEVPMVPDLGVMSEQDIVSFVKLHPLSMIANEPLVMEGVVCRSEPLMLFRSGKPIMFKLKCKDMK